MDARHDNYWELIAKYLKDDISEEEKTTLLDWVEQAPENKEVFYRTSHLWQLTGKARDAFQPDVDKAWRRFQQATGQPETQKENSIGTEVKTLPLNRAPEAKQVSLGWTRIAAAFLVMLGIGYWLFVANTSKEAERVAQATENQKKDFYLPDGSHVFLNRNSRISYDKDLAGDQRVIHLKGEAFFDVKRNSQRPFVIYTAQARVEVLGTSFTVREDARQQTTEVDVVTGKVAFSGKNPADTTRLYLKPGFKGVLNRQQGLTQAKIDDPNFIAWKVDKLVFDNTRLSSVITTMEAYFGVTIEVQNPQLLNCRYTGDFEKPALEEVLNVLHLATNLDYEKQADRYILSGGGCAKNQ